MNELRGFLHWQWSEIRGASWMSWLYFIGMALLAAGVISDNTITYVGVRFDWWLMITGGIFCLTFFIHSAISIQLARYRYEKDRILQALERKE